MNLISYITTKDDFPTALSSYFEAHGFSLQPYELDNTKETQVSVLLLFTPFYTNGIYVSAESIWKKHLSTIQPKTILLTAGFRKAKHPNHLDLLDLPASFPSFLRTALPVEEEWQPIFSGGLDMDEKLQRFFEGHGQESVIEILHNIIRILNIARAEITIYQTSYAAITEDLIRPSNLAEKWRELRIRWVNYFPYFEYLPFQNLFCKVDQLFNFIDPFFSSGCEDEELLNELNCIGNLKTIKDQLAMIGNQYVY